MRTIHVYSHRDSIHIYHMLCGAFGTIRGRNRELDYVTWQMVIRELEGGVTADANHRGIEEVQRCETCFSHPRIQLKLLARTEL